MSWDKGMNDGQEGGQSLRDDGLPLTGGNRPFLLQ